ncbi:hypothetical protein ACM64Y_01685 [Novispirillum sp. DQ9]|uniref:hypothetical protein n=1 Tax=Novispirillum sp. DQ9 TaxID=3398612 RepID=UPI003C79A78E
MTDFANFEPQVPGLSAIDPVPRGRKPEPTKPAGGPSPTVKKLMADVAALQAEVGALKEQMGAMGADLAVMRDAAEKERIRAIYAEAGKGPGLYFQSHQHTRPTD